MKNVLIICAGIIGFLALPVIYSTVKGYTTWFWRDPHAQLFVNGQRVPGYVHQSKHVIIVTRSDLAKRHSYWFGLDGQSTALSNYCGSWSAPDFFVFVMGDVNPPCFMIREIAYDIEESPQPGVPIVRHGRMIEFYTNDRKLIRVEY
jgi:hypothetical protein